MLYRTPLLAVALLSVGFSGCRTAPPDLGAHPDRQALLVIESAVVADMLFGLMSVSHDVDEASICPLARSGERIQGVAWKDYIIFRDLEPGRYGLRRLHAKSSIWNNWEDWQFLLAERELPESLQPTLQSGQVLYLGKIVVNQETGLMGFDRAVRVDETSKRELRALRRILAADPKSAWADILRARIKSIETPAPAPAAAPPTPAP
ncbi:MAG: hypothetical protein ACKVX7_17400 [Planctomycetota bacterium]